MGKIGVIVPLKKVIFTKLENKVTITNGDLSVLKQLKVIEQLQKPYTNKK